jgi:hypothetical protein
LIQRPAFHRSGFFFGWLPLLDFSIRVLLPTQLPFVAVDFFDDEYQVAVGERPRVLVPILGPTVGRYVPDIVKEVLQLYRRFDLFEPGGVSALLRPY